MCYPVNLSGDYLNLIILRHGDAGARTANPVEDNGRGLTHKGKKEVRQVAKALEEMNMDIRYMASSPLKRARETAEIVASVLDMNEDLELWDELKPEEETSILLDRLGKLKEDSNVLIIGHEPCLSILISVLVSGKKTSRISLKKAGAAKLSVEYLIPKPSGELKWLLTPKQMKRLS